MLFNKKFINELKKQDKQVMLTSPNAKGNEDFKKQIMMLEDMTIDENENEEIPVEEIKLRQS